VKGVIALVSGYALLAILAVPSLLPAADPEPVPAPGPEAVEPTPPAASAPAPVNGADPQPTQVEPSPSQQAGTTEVVEVEAEGRQATHEVAMRDLKFIPKKINVAVGDTVTWRNDDTEPHNAIANDDSFRTETIQGGETVSATIDESGSHPYFCSIHAGMEGTVVAGGGGGSGSGGGGGGGGSSGGSGSGGSGTSGSGTSTGPSPSASSGAATGSTGTTSSSSASSGSLPSTGSDELWFALAGAWLLTVGAAIRSAAAGAR
jgi:LPXTG-motif cell wall-anchored protein